MHSITSALIQALIFDRFIEWANLQIDKVLNPVLSWIFLQPFHLVSALGVVIITTIVVKSYVETRPRISSKKLIRLEPFPKPDNIYASIKVFNTSNSRVKCYAYFTKLIHVYTPNTRLPILDELHPGQARLSWDGGSSNGEKVIDPGPLPTLLNISYISGNDFMFCFHDGEKRYPGQRFEIDVDFYCEISDKLQSIKKFTGCFEMITTDGDSIIIPPNVEIREGVCGDIQSLKAA